LRRRNSFLHATSSNDAVTNYAAVNDAVTSYAIVNDDVATAANYV